MGIQGIMQTLKAVLKEMVIEEVILCDKVKKESHDFLNKLKKYYKIKNLVLLIGMDLWKSQRKLSVM